jgi:hypothetical protein
MRAYIVERLVDGPSERAEAVVRECWPGAEILHGTVAIGEGRWGTAAAWRRDWPGFVRTLDTVIASRRTLALGGTVEVEDAMALGLDVWTVHGRKLYPVTHLWYAEQVCLSRCVNYAHRGRMHADPNHVAETRHGESSLVADGRRPVRTMKA